MSSTVKLKSPAASIVGPAQVLTLPDGTSVTIGNDRMVTVDAQWTSILLNDGWQLVASDIASD
jgi:hypothetical protein